MVAAPYYSPSGARVSTTKMQTAYFGSGMIWGRPESRAWVKQIIRNNLRLAKTKDERHRTMQVWKKIHYLATGRSPLKPKSTHITYYLDLPGWTAPAPFDIPAACATLIYAKPGGIKPLLGNLGCSTPMEVMELVRNFVADDVREIRDFSPAVLREIVRRMRQGDDWEWNNARLEKPVQCRPRWLVTYADPAVGHDAGLYVGAGARFIAESASGKLLYAWPLYIGG